MKAQKNLFIVALLSLTSVSFSFAQQPVFEASNDVRLDISSTSGTNGVAVAYNPKKDLYYTAFAGNASYEIEVFNGQGFSVFKKEIGGDLRGMWFNEKANKLEGILYGNAGSFTMPIGSDGFPGDIQITTFAYNMGDQDVATRFKKKVYFCGQEGFYIFGFGKTSNKVVSYPSGFDGQDTYNMNGIMHTGVKGYEIGLYNHVNNTLDLFDEKTGAFKLNVKLNFISGETIETPYTFRVSYCNNRLFLFDTEKRQWHGFSIFR